MLMLVCAGWAPSSAGLVRLPIPFNLSYHDPFTLLPPGAIAVGKTNMDQFAAGLVGTRTPHAVPRSPFDCRFISGGSSSGSGAAVGSGLVSFALGTDTAGSGRVPAGLCGCVGVKPTVGSVSTVGGCRGFGARECRVSALLVCLRGGAVHARHKASSARSQGSVRMQRSRRIPLRLTARSLQTCKLAEHPCWTPVPASAPCPTQCLTSLLRY